MKAMEMEKRERVRVELRTLERCLGGYVAVRLEVYSVALEGMKCIDMFKCVKEE